MDGVLCLHVSPATAVPLVTAHCRLQVLRAGIRLRVLFASEEHKNAAQGEPAARRRVGARAGGVRVHACRSG